MCHILMFGTARAVIGGQGCSSAPSARSSDMNNLSFLNLRRIVLFSTDSHV